jgi:phenylacetic acid degradation protein paaN
MALSAQYKTILDNAIKAIHERVFFAQYPEHPKAYGEDGAAQGLEKYNGFLQHQFTELLQENPAGWAGEEVSPFTGEKLGIQYPTFEVENIMIRAGRAMSSWRQVSVDDRAEVLIDSLERIAKRFNEIAYATMHTTGQAYMMSFQASGPHANDRALEALALGYEELSRFPAEVIWEKPMGKTNVVLNKQFKAIPKGVGLVIGCSTFPIWNSVPGMYASLITGNSIIVKPHPKAILPIAIVVAEIQQALKAKGLDPLICQLTVDTSEKLISKELCEHPLVKIIDYTGGSSFGAYVESLKDKSVFTEKAGVNSVIIDSVAELAPVVQNLSFAVSLYSGQMCTAPQNFFIPASGVKAGDKTYTYDEVVAAFKDGIAAIANNPKMAAGTYGAIQNELTIKRVDSVKKLDAAIILDSQKVENAEFPNARTISPIVLELDAKDFGIYENELFGPIILFIKTKDTDESIRLAKEMSQKHGAITCAAYCTDATISNKIIEEMEMAFTPVSLNLTGMIWVNQHAAFSDFHVTGGNPAGNASFTNPEYINKRFVWVGHRSV